eukprot:2669504-Rhodomonas_salina.1
MQPQQLPAAAAAAHDAAALTTADALNIVYCIVDSTPADDDKESVADTGASDTKNNSSNAEGTCGDGSRSDADDRESEDAAADDKDSDDASDYSDTAGDGDNAEGAPAPVADTLCMKRPALHLNYLSMQNAQAKLQRTAGSKLQGGGYTAVAFVTFPGVVEVELEPNYDSLPWILQWEVTARLTKPSRALLLQDLQDQLKAHINTLPWEAAQNVFSSSICIAAFTGSNKVSFLSSSFVASVTPY